ncbi:hypothetical protein LOC67_26450 [Stieleria sp. JC731]|uniref:hypothetical protein n=1 Tax=Pirellulaceae TaxID=2691357 RepID=UPI001E377506|nr:hypothetical protein [Stieleria sp. JC731]MCC9604110.1 hypothetical protein [Stieleria sp. JC731]
MNEHEPQTIDLLVSEQRAGRIGRRSFLRAAVVAGLTSAAAYQLLGEANAQQPRMTTMALGEEGNPPLDPKPGDPKSKDDLGTPKRLPTTERGGEESKPTTLAVGEESRPSPPYPTTMAVGEESPSIQPPSVTTRAWGEEQSCTKPPQYKTPGKATTLAFGEESQGTPPAQVTTRAIGEESTRRSVPDTSRWLQRSSPWKGFRRW